jgi:hypothetical protein
MAIRPLGSASFMVIKPTASVGVVKGLLQEQQSLSRTLFVFMIVEAHAEARGYKLELPALGLDSMYLFRQGVSRGFPY